MLVPSVNEESSAFEMKSALDNMLTQLQIPIEQCQIGETKIFLRDIKKVEETREKLLHKYAVKIQKTWRMFWIKQYYKELRGASVGIQSIARKFLARRKFVQNRKAAVALQAPIRTTVARQNFSDVRCAVLLLQAVIKQSRATKYLEAATELAPVGQAAVRAYLSRKGYVLQRDAQLRMEAEQRERELAEQKEREKEEQRRKEEEKRKQEEAERKRLEEEKRKQEEARRKLEEEKRLEEQRKVKERDQRQRRMSFAHIQEHIQHAKAQPPAAAVAKARPAAEMDDVDKELDDLITNIDKLSGYDFDTMELDNPEVSFDDEMDNIIGNAGNGNITVFLKI